MTPPVLTFAAMGTGVRLLSDAPLPNRLADAVRACFEELEGRFSLYRQEAEGARIAAGALELSAASEEYRGAYEEALSWRSATDGDFTPHRPDGAIDLSGIVKAYALRDAAAALADASSPWLLEAGGDLLAGGGTGAPDPWRVGIADPSSATGALLTAVPLGSRWRAIATSGTSERGEHIWRTNRLGNLRQVTVLGDDIVTCDVLATAILAGGLPALDRETRRQPIEVLTVSDDGELRVTPDLRHEITARNRQPPGNARRVV